MKSPSVKTEGFLFAVCTLPTRARFRMVQSFFRKRKELFATQDPDGKGTELLYSFGYLETFSILAHYACDATDFYG